MAVSRKNSMQSQAYEFIRNKIVNCEYAPNQLLSEAVLQEELGFSRTPVREAIGRLEQEGLLKVFPKRGIVVSGFTISDISMLFEVRRLIEPYVLRNYGMRLDRNEVMRFEKIFRSHLEAEEYEGFYELDSEFHSFLVSVVPNDYLRDLYARIQMQNTRLRVLSGQLIDERLKRTMAEHTEIAEACLEENWERAAIAMSRHLQFSEESSLASILKSHGSSIVL